MQREWICKCGLHSVNGPCCCWNCTAVLNATEWSLSGSQRQIEEDNLYLKWLHAEVTAGLKHINWTPDPVLMGWVSNEQRQEMRNEFV